MTEIKIPREHLPMLREMAGAPIFANLKGFAIRDFINILIAAAEADAPPLPEGWYLLKSDDRDHVCRPLWCDGEGTLYEEKGEGGYVWAGVDDCDGTLTPLRPTVTEADVEKARVVLWERTGLNHTTSATAAAFRAAGIEVA